MYPTKQRELILALCLLCCPALALQTDHNQAIHLQADRVELDDKAQTSMYRGNVQMQQGSLKIKADEVKVLLTNGRVEKIIIRGNPASFEQQPERQTDIVRSRADYMEYFAQQERLILKANAEVIQGKNEFRGDHIEYDTLNSVVKAHKDTNSSTRVEAVIQPKSSTPQPDSPGTSTP